MSPLDPLSVQADALFEVIRIIGSRMELAALIKKQDEDQMKVYDRVESYLNRGVYLPYELAIRIAYYTGVSLERLCSQAIETNKIMREIKCHCSALPKNIALNTITLVKSASMNAPLTTSALTGIRRQYRHR